MCMCAHLYPNLKGRKKKKRNSFGAKPQLVIMNGGIIMKELGPFKKSKWPQKDSSADALRMAA